VIEQGIVQLLTANAGVAALTPAGGGFLAELPKGQTLPSWTYRGVSNVPVARGLNVVAGLRTWHVQIDCYGYSAADVLALAGALGLALNGYHGTLSDGGSTIVDSAFWSDAHDPEFDSDSRTWRRVLEFEVNYVSQF
jgi:hypothetical protein